MPWKNRGAMSVGIQIVRLAITSVLVAISWACDASAEAPYSVAWQQNFGAWNGNWNFGVAVDGTGHVYTSGGTGGSFAATSAGDIDAFVTKFDRAGNMQWARQFGTNQFDLGYGVAVDQVGSVYSAGRTYGSLFATNNGGSDGFLVKYDSSGNQLWSRQMHTNAWDEVLAIAVEPSGNVFITGDSYGSLAGNHIGGDDAILFKIDSNGNTIWSRQFGTEGDERGNAVAVDSAGNAYVGGGLYSSFLTKFDPDGNQLWTRNIAASYQDCITSIAVDAFNNVFVSGFTDGNLANTNAGRDDVFVAKYDAAGNQLWIRQIGTLGDDISNAIAVDAAGNAFITGYTQGAFGSSSEAEFLDIFLAEFDASGEFKWLTQLPAPDFESADAVAVNSLGEVFVGGSWGSIGQRATLIQFVVPEPPTFGMICAGVCAYCFALRGVTSGSKLLGLQRT